ncbi:response regulator [Lachnospiraceae bacterium 42-17]|jgi:signal transduction histidine kinase/CheY-like chemotaxis protein|nr:response regulator [Dorea sp.]
MSKIYKKGQISRSIVLNTAIILVFCILSTIVFFVSGKITTEMSESAISNLNESLDLIEGTIQAILKREAEFQKLIAQELGTMDSPDEFIRSYDSNNKTIKISFISSGKATGISNTGEAFSADGLDFSSGNTVDDLPISNSYINDMGTWAYTMKCPVMKDGKETATLYMEYIYDSLDEALPGRFYNGTAVLYIMDTESERLVLKPKGIGERSAGHIDLQDFYRANKILEKDIQSEVTNTIKNNDNIMFYHQIQEKDSLIYMWSVNNGSIYLIGYVPVEAIQREGNTVNQYLFIVILVMLSAFLICCILYYLNKRQQDKIRKEQEAEREKYNKQLSEALKAAQIASSSKTTFLSNMSHDIRTPMNAILGFTTLLLKEVNNPVKVREYTEKITASGQHLLSLINDVLDVSKIESGKVMLTIGEFTLNNMISAVDAIIRPMARTKNQDFSVSVTGIRHEHLIGDETRINQILINLLSNSVKYTPEGGHIWFRIIGLKQRSAQYEHIRIEVEDNGYGMTPEYLKVIFDAFTRAENSTTNKVQGTGLGMAITKNIVELMGGTIDVASEVDKGTLFTVDLELRIPDKKADELFWKENGILRILAVDDEKDVAAHIKTLMEETNVITDTALCGEDALRLVQAACDQDAGYNIILLDLMMPKMDGIETAKRLRTIIPEDIPILFLTSYDWEALQEEADVPGVTDFLSKPFFVSAFKEKLMEIYSKQKLTESDFKPSKKGILAGQYFLVAEDNEINSEILSELLDIHGAACEITENGRAAVERFASSAPGEFAAILMDVQMPVMNGYEATKAIRALKREDAGTIPIIAMTANAFAEDVKDAKAAGMNEHIAKPLNMEIVEKILSKYL